MVGKRTPLAKQSVGLLPMALNLALCLWALVQNSMASEVKRMDRMSVLYILVASYAYSDYWMWMLHCFLDRQENLKARWRTIKDLATLFQMHHDVASDLLKGNHLGDVDDLSTAVAGTGILLGAFTSPSTKLITAGICTWGSLGDLNHFYCHARNARYEIPALFKYGQDWGFLPTAAHHKNHHTAPFEENWNFLNGAHKLYEAIYFSTGSNYDGLMWMFYLCNPVCLQIWAYILSTLFLETDSDFVNAIDTNTNTSTYYNLSGVY